MKTLKELMEKLEVCHESCEWVKDKTIEQVVNKCNRADFLILLSVKIGIDSRKIILTNGHIANTVRHLIEDKDILKCIDATISYGRGDMLRNKFFVYTRAAKKSIHKYKIGKAEFYCPSKYYAALSGIMAGKLIGSSISKYKKQVNNNINILTSRASFWQPEIDGLSSEKNREKNLMDTSDIVRRYIGHDIINKVNQLLNN